MHTSIKVSRKTRKAIFIDGGLHYKAKILAANENMTLKSLLEGQLAELLSIAKK